MATNETGRSGWRVLIPSRFVWILPVVLLLASFGWTQLGAAMHIEVTMWPSMDKHPPPSPYPAWVVNGWGIIWILLVLANGLLQFPFIVWNAIMDGSMLRFGTEFQVALMFLEEALVLYCFVQIPLHILYLIIEKTRRRHEKELQSL